MKKQILILLTILPCLVFAQTKTSVADGNFYALSTWDCFCLPANGDTIVINHKVSMNAGIAYTAGQITVSGFGELTDDGTDKDILINGGQFFNYGTLDCDGFLLESGYVFNLGEMYLDSLWTRDTMDNQGPIVTFDFLNDQDAKFLSTRPVTVNNNFANQGYFALSGTEMSVANNFSNCNISSSDATAVIENSVLCVDNDFLNCGTDTLRGNGDIFITGTSTNGGEVEGSLDINTPTGSFNFNTGNVESTVTFGTANCYLGNEQQDIFEVQFYPNPSNGLITLSENNLNYSLVDISGKTIESGISNGSQLDFTSYSTGVYFLELSKENSRVVYKIILE